MPEHLDAPPPEIVAAAILRQLFADGLKGHMAYIAMHTVVGGLTEWRRQLLENKSAEAAQLMKQLADTRMEMQELRTRLFFLESEKSGKIAVSG